MIVIQAPIGYGKTTQSLYFANHQEAHIIVANQEIKRKIEFRIKQLGHKNIKGVLTFEEACGPGVKLDKVIIDDVDFILQNLLGARRLAISFSNIDNNWVED